MPSTGQQLVTLERLLSLSIVDTGLALVQAADLVAEAFRADKVDVFLYDPARDSLNALGSSTQPLSAAQKRHGLDVLPVSNGGRTVDVYVTGKTLVSGHVEDDPEELRGIKEALKVRSQVGVPLDVGGKRRGVLLIASQEPELWGAEDGHFAEAVARWVGAVVRQTELVEELERGALAAGRRTVAEDLVTVLAHDLRNFIYPVDLAIQMVQRRAVQEKRSEDIKDTTRARRGLARLNALVTDILDVARIEQGLLTVEARPLALGALLEETAAVLSTEEQPVIVTADQEVPCVVDPARIKQCVENLVVNALKHSPKNVPVSIRLAAEDSAEGQRARIEVTDRGPGVAPEVLPHIFERFVTGPKKRAGLGLGLFIARQIARMHQGDLRVESDPAHGATFILTLPCGEADEGA